MNKSHCSSPKALLNEQQHLSEGVCQGTLPHLCELRNTAKNWKEGQSYTRICCLSCINSFLLSAIKNSHKTQFIFLQYASPPSLGLVYTLKVVFSKANRDGTPHAKLFIAQGLYYTHLPARMWNYWSEPFSFFSALTNLHLKEIQLHSAFLYSVFPRIQAPWIPYPSWGLVLGQMTFVVRVTICKETWIQCFLWMAFIHQCSWQSRILWGTAHSWGQWRIVLIDENRHLVNHWG